MSTPFCWEGGGGAQEKLTCLSQTSTSNFLGGPEGTGDVPNNKNSVKYIETGTSITELH